MFLQSLKSKKFKAKIVRFFKQNHEEIFDIILFGSTARGKEKPHDLDILVLFKNTENTDKAYEVRQLFKELNIDTRITTKTYTSLMSISFAPRESFLSEGYSLVNSKPIAEALGYTSFILFKYELKGFTQSKRMMFHYSLYGRANQGGIIKSLSLIKFSDTILLSKITSAEKTKEYLTQWGIKFTMIPILIPLRLYTE